MIFLLLLCAIRHLASASPNTNLPINAQVPPVARVDQPFRFTFSASTFTSTATITYTLSDAPSWLVLDSLSRTFSGIPHPDNTGSLVVDLNAADDTGSMTMPVTLVVSADPGPAIGLPLTDQLPAYGAFSAPDSILLTPSSPLSISFSPSTFSNTSGDTMYYAISDNNTPLPSWIHFDPANLSFSGTAPQAKLPADASQRFGIRLTASNVVGFSDADLSFKIVIEENLLYFRQNVQIFNITAGTPIDTVTLIDPLISNGRQATPSDLTQAWSPSTPPWLSLDSKTLVISGTPPAGFKGQNFTVTVSNAFGSTATTIVVLQSARSSAELFLNPIGAANATIGTDFVYPLGPIVNATNLEIEVALGIASAWLDYDQMTQTIKGHVPGDLMPQQVVVNITARQGLQSESVILTIAVQVASGSDIPGSNSAAPVGSTENSSTQLPSLNNMQRGWIAAAVLGPLSLILVLAILFTYCRRRRRGRRQKTYLNDSPNSSSVKISRPINHEENSQEANTAPTNRRSESKLSSRISLAPRLDRNWSVGGSIRWSKNASSSLPAFKSIAEERALKRADPEISRTMKAKSQVAGRVLKRQNQMRSGFGHGKPEPGKYKNDVLFGPPVQKYASDYRAQGRRGLLPLRRSWRNTQNSQSDSWTEISTSVTEDSDRARDQAFRYTIRPVASNANNIRRDSSPLPSQSLNRYDNHLPTPSHLESPSLSPSQQEPLRISKRKHGQIDLTTFPRTISVKQGVSRSQSNPFYKGESTYVEEAKRLHKAHEHSASLKRPPRSFLRTSRDSRFDSFVPSEASNYDDDTFDNLSNSAGHCWLPPLRNPLRANPIDAEDVRAGLSAAEAAESKSGGPLRELAKRLSRPKFRSGVSSECDTQDEETTQPVPRTAMSEGDSDLLGHDATVRSQSESSARAGMTRGQRLGYMTRDAPGNRSMRGEIKRSTSGSFV